MSIIIRLYASQDSNPFTIYRWDVDFEAGVAAIVINADPADSPVNLISSGVNIYSPGLNWEVTFSPALTDPTLFGRKVSELLSDGDVVLGSYFNDVLRMTSHNDKVSGGDGDDVIFGRGGDDHLIGGNGDDYLDGGAGADLLEGGWGDDTYRIDEFDTIIEVYDDYGSDTVEAAFSYTAPKEIENVRLLGSSDIDATGNASSNALWGNDGDNALRGLAGEDELYGGAGSDYLVGGKGWDILVGGAGADKFVFDHTGSRWYGDEVMDFSRAEGDRLVLDRDAFLKLKKAGPLKKKFFDAGNKRADDKNDYIVYHKKKGTLYYDPDGSGQKKAYVIAEFDGNPKLKASDFDII